MTDAEIDKLIAECCIKPKSAGELDNLRRLARAVEREAMKEPREIIEGLCNQFAYPVSRKDGFHLGTGGLSVLEEGFEFLGWRDPHPAPWRECDEPGCTDGATCGWPHLNGYRRTCGKHQAKP